MTSDGLFDYDPPRVLDTTTASRMELEMLLAEGFGVSPESVYRVLEQHLADELYTVTYGNKIVACVFLKTIDLYELKARYHDPDRFFPLCRYFLGSIRKFSYL